MLKKGNDPLGTVMFNIKGHRVKLDREDLEKVVRRTWQIKHMGYRIYFRTRNSNRKNIPLHRFILKVKKGQIVDHISGDTLDNRKRNLRIVTAQQSTWNTGPRKGLKYKGVEKKVVKGKWTGKWRAKLRKQGRTYVSRSFPTIEQAAKARDKLSRKHHGQYARLNFPVDPNKVMLRQ